LEDHLSSSNLREPVVDVIEEEKTIRVVVELPGMKKEEIQLNATENSLSLKAEGENRKYFRDVPLPVKVDTSSAKATYLNGILEVTLQKKRIESNEQAVKINID
jgi:HSP20 family protein